MLVYRMLLSTVNKSSLAYLDGINTEKLVSLQKVLFY